MLKIAAKGVLFGLLVLAACSHFVSAQPNIVTAENPQFEIVGLHARSVSYMDELSKHVTQVAARFLDKDGLQFPQRILVTLKPEEFVRFEGDYSVRYGERGFVNLDFRWEESLDLQTACQALTEALVVRYSIFNYGQEGPDMLPEWPIAAIGTQAYLSLRPAQSARAADWFDPEATLAIDILLRRSWNDAASDANGYALLLAMERSGFDRRRVRALIGQSIAGLDIRTFLSDAIQSKDPTVEAIELNDWWHASLVQLLLPEEELMETMAASRGWIEALADFSEVGKEELSLKQIWEERENVDVRNLIEARYEIIKLRIVRVNPAYFNSARSLGALFESYLEEGRRHKFMHQLAAFLSDFEDAKVLEEAVIRALSTPNG